MPMEHDRARSGQKVFPAKYHPCLIHKRENLRRVPREQPILGNVTCPCATDGENVHVSSYGDVLLAYT